MKLFTVGPVEMSKEICSVGGEQLPYFRTQEFSEIMLDIKKRYLELVDASEDCYFIPLTASGTGAMEASVMNVLDKKDKVLVISGGSFGKRFEEICECHEIPYESLILPFGTVLEKEMLLPYENKGFTALLVNIHETSIGQLYDIKMLGDFCLKNGMYFIVDAISSFLADPLSMKEHHIDVLITSSQKALALAPGMSFVVVSNDVWKNCIEKKEKKSLYFDFQDHAKNMERGQTPFTPAVGIILQLSERLKELDKMGLEKIIDLHAGRAAYFRQKCTENGIKFMQYPKSNALTPLYFPERNAKDIFNKLKDKYGLMLTPNGGDLSDVLLRVGHLGNLQYEDYDRVINALKEELK